MNTLSSLLAETEKKKLDAELKKAFSAIAAPIVIDGKEREALIFLVNRTITGQKKFLDESSLELLSDDTWQNDILKVTAWIHTHNLKYPYSKADGCIFFYDEDLRQRTTKVLGYAKDSKQINKSQFLITEFLWNGAVTSIVEQFAFYDSSENSLVDLLVELGFPSDGVRMFQDKCSAALNIRTPDAVHSACKQVRFLQDNGQFLAVTPVVNTSIQHAVHQLTKNPEIKATTVFHARPSALGNFVSATGGRVRCLYYPPILGHQDRSIDFLVNQWRSKHHLLNEQALFKKQALNLFYSVLRGKEKFSTYQARKAEKETIRHGFQDLLEGLFSEILYLKTREQKEYNQLEQVIDGSVESGVVRDCFDLEETTNHFNRQIQELLEKTRHGNELAYQPLLMDILDREIRLFLSRKTSKEPSAEGIYLHFERLLAYEANCQSNPYLVGIPSLTAFAGLVEAFLSKLGVTGRRAFAIGLRRFARRKGHPLAKQVYKNHTVKNDTLIDSQHCDLEFDLVVRLSSSDQRLDFSDHNLYRCLPRRFAGGVLSSPIIGSYQQSSLFKRCNLYSTEMEFAEGLHRLPSYTRFIADIGPEKDNNVVFNELPNVLKTSPNIFPVNKGFKFIGSLCLRTGAIADLHAYAEHIFGLIKLKAPASLVAFNEDRKQIFWTTNISEYGIELLSGEPHDRTM